MNTIIMIFVLMEGLSVEKYTLLKAILIDELTFNQVSRQFHTNAETIKAIFHKLVDISNRTYGIDLAHISGVDTDALLRQLSTSSHPSVSKIVTYFQTSVTYEHALAKMVFDTDPHIRKLVARFCYTPQSLLEHLTGDPESTVNSIAVGRLRKKGMYV